jgi:hypothetical protein
VRFFDKTSSGLGTKIPEEGVDWTGRNDFRELLYEKAKLMYMEVEAFDPRSPDYFLSTY